jgi:hypothetical protein
MRSRIVSRVTLLAVCLSMVVPAAAQVPHIINCQGILVDNTGAPLPGPVPVIFAVWNHPEAGDSLWSEVVDVFPDDQGRFDALLGVGSPIPDSAFVGPAFLSLQVSGDTEMVPRQHLVSVAYAYQAQFAHEAGISFVAAPWSVNSEAIIDGAIQMPDLGQSGAAPGQVIKWSGSEWFPADDETGGGDGGHWTVIDSVIFTNEPWGITRGGANNGILGDAANSAVNWGMACTTGVAGLEVAHATVSGGHANKASASFSTVGGGSGNIANDSGATIGGGYNNVVQAPFSTVAGGMDNRARGRYSFVGGGGGSGGVQGDSNAALGDYATVSGGSGNVAAGKKSFIGGGYFNIGLGDGSAIAGGQTNEANAIFSFVGGGTTNRSNGYASTIAGGSLNFADSNHASVGGGNVNQASMPFATVSGGSYNFIFGESGFIGGGGNNTISGSGAVISGGQFNRARGEYSVIGGGGGPGIGDSNSVSGDRSFIGGGSQNILSVNDAVICGGLENEITAGVQSAIVGGQQNSCAGGGIAFIGGGAHNANSSTYGVIGGGSDNTADGPQRAAIGGGGHNRAGGWYSTVGGGAADSALGYAATVPGGEQNCAAGQYSLAAGRRAKALHNGSFVWADETNADFASTGNNQFLIRASGGVGIGTTSPEPGYQLDVNGLAWFSIGGGSIALTTPGGWPGMIMYSPNGHRRDIIFDNSTMRMVTSNSSSAPAGDNGISIEETGEVGIGTTTPNYTLDVRGQIGNNTTLYHSDIRWKSDVENLSGSLERIKSLRGVSYRWRRDEFPAMAFPEGKQLGVIAQEVEAVIPEVVKTADDGFKSVEYAKLVALLIEAVKEQCLEIDQLKSRIKTLEGQKTINQR